MRACNVQEVFFTLYLWVWEWQWNSKSENECNRLLKPFDVNELKKAFNRITPSQLCKLLALPIYVPASVRLFQWAFSQRSYCYSFDVYNVLFDKLRDAGESDHRFSLLIQMKEERVLVYRD
ncbi:hypothetical protein SLA2020_516570 [Shorea laevis]